MPDESERRSRLAWLIASGCRNKTKSDRFEEIDVLASMELPGIIRPEFCCRSCR